MDVASYLQRIGYAGTCDPTVGTLRQLHRAHLQSVPFENLDIPLGRPIVLALPALFEKVVLRRRGGFCYELNGLFAWLLRELGFRVDMLSGRVFGPGGPGREFAHMLLVVDAGARLAADVGFGDSFVEPIPLGGDGQGQPGHSYRVVERSEGWRLERRLPESDWEPQYAFTTTPHALDAFRPMCDYHQTSPDSTFTRKSVCSRATPAGRVTLANGRLIVTSDGRRQERMVATTEEYRALLEAHFRIDLGEEAEKAMKPALGTASGAPGDDG